LIAHRLRCSLSLAACSSAVALAGCQAAPPAQVIAADGVLCDITRRLAASDLAVECLLQPGDDPHQFRLTPRQTRALSEAQLVLINGYGLTPALGDQPHSLAVAERAVPGSPLLEKPEPHSAHDKADHHDGNRDPHAWHDPRQAAAMVRLVALQLEALKPSASAAIAARATAMTAVLQRLDRWNRQQFATIPNGKTLATGHRAFASLARAYGLQELPVVDALSSSDSLRPQAFQAVVQDLQRQKVAMLFAEQLPAGKALQRISALSGVPLAATALVADGLAKTNGEPGNLVSTLSDNTCLIVNGLKGRCDSPSQKNLIHSWQAIR